MDEMQDVYDALGNKTGEQKTKAEIFRSGSWRQVVHALVVDPYSGNLLVQQRVSSKGIFDSLWDVSIGGGVTAGEDPASACLRELEEELGLKVKSVELIPIGRFKIPKLIPEKNLWSNEFSSVFAVLRTVKVEELLLQKSEVAATKFMELDAFESEATDPMTAGLWVPHGPDFYHDICSKVKELQ